MKQCICKKCHHIFYFERDIPSQRCKQCGAEEIEKIDLFQTNITSLKEEKACEDGICTFNVEE